MPKQRKILKCTKTKYCDTLMERVRDDDKPGILIQHFTNRNTGKYTRSLIVHKMDRKDNGLIFNACPWCGVNIENRHQ